MEQHIWSIKKTYFMYFEYHIPNKAFYRTEKKYKDFFFIFRNSKNILDIYLYI